MFFSFRSVGMTITGHGPLVTFPSHDTRLTIRNNVPIDDILHVVAVISNPCQFKRRFQLAQEFIYRIKAYEQHIQLHVVELAYGDDPFHIEDSHKIRVDTHPIWIKESLINFAIRNLLPFDWKAVAWIDADIEFENETWAIDALKILNGSKDIIQLFSHAVDMNQHEDAMNIFTGFGFQWAKNKTYSNPTWWHPGFAWACTRNCFERMGGLYDLSILGAGDHNMALSLIGHAERSINKDVSDGYKKSILEFGKRCKGLRVGYVPGVIRHFFHGSKVKRGYGTRWNILVRHKYDPYEDTFRDQNGIVCIRNEHLARDILHYFASRDEDEFLGVQ